MSVHNPIPESYWVVPQQLLAGEYPRDLRDDLSQPKIDRLIDAGVSVFIDLTEEGEHELKKYTQYFASHADKDIIHVRYAIPDVSVPRSHSQTMRILDAIDLYLAQHRTVYVHCFGGIGRTGTIIGCWLSRHGYPGESALARLRQLWKQCVKSAYTDSPQTREQAQYVLHWKDTE